MNREVSYHIQKTKKYFRSYCKTQKMQYLCTALENNADITAMVR